MKSDLLDIIPFKNRNNLRVSIPGSKSISNRALILAVLNDGPVRLSGILNSEDVQIMISCLKQLGINIDEDKNSNLLTVM